METEYRSFDNQKFKTEKECLEYEETAKRLFKEKSIYWIDSCGKLHQEGDIADFIYEAEYVYLPNKDAVKDFKYFVPIWLRGKWYQAILNKVEEPCIYFRSQTSTLLVAYLNICAINAFPLLASSSHFSYASSFGLNISFCA